MCKPFCYQISRDPILSTQRISRGWDMIWYEVRNDATENRHFQEKKQLLQWYKKFNRVIMSSCHHVIMASWHHVIISSCHHVIMSSCHRVIMSSCHHVIMSSSHHAIKSSCKHVLLVMMLYKIYVKFQFLNGNWFLKVLHFA